MLLSAVLVCVVLLMFALVFGGIIRNVRAAYLQRIRALRRDAIVLENEVKDMRADLIIRQARITNLEKDVEALEMARERERAAALAAADKAPSRTVVEALQYMGKVTSEDVLRARTYLESTKSNSSVEEALLILGIVTPEDVSMASKEAM